MAKNCNKNTALHSRKRKSLLCLMTKERKIPWHHPEFFLGAEEELEEVGAQATSLGLLAYLAQPVFCYRAHFLER